ncbi:serine/threonine-protein kinase STY46-like [Canna indica]|uniref:non-specific serine/threonine protein kinase n=1 Tax=Canna indica TaxID=4628 RepID=A0AAQ3K314_9LILI|nr:serine/threonine-protein kinase STY46-like [Canna indica]
MSSEEVRSAADAGGGAGRSGNVASSSVAPPPLSSGKQKQKATGVNRTWFIMSKAHQNDPGSVLKLLQKDPSLVDSRDYDNRTLLHMAAIYGWTDLAMFLLDHGADVNPQNRWNNTPLADAERGRKRSIIELLKSYGGLSLGHEGSHSEPIPPLLPNKRYWEIDPSEVELSSSKIIGKGSFGEILKAYWHGTCVAVKRILPSYSGDERVIREFRHEVDLLAKLRHPNIVQFLGAVTEKTPLMIITEYMEGGDLYQFLRKKGNLSPSRAIKFAIDIARGMAYLHNEPDVIVHRDLKPSNVLLVNSNAGHLKVGDFGLSKSIRVGNSNDVYRMTGETGSCRYMAPEVFLHRRYNKRVDVFSFAMILYQMLQGYTPYPLNSAYEATTLVSEGHRPSMNSQAFTPELQDLVKNCWAADMNARPSFLDILQRLEEMKNNMKKSA